MPETFLYVTISVNGLPPMVPLIVGRNWVYVTQYAEIDIGLPVLVTRALPMRTIVVQVDEELK